MIRINEKKINPQKVFQNESFSIYIKVESDKKSLKKLKFKLPEKLGGGIKDGTTKN